MQMIALVVLRLRVAGLLRIGDDLVEVDHAIERAASEEGVQGQPNFLLFWIVIALKGGSVESAIEGGQCGGDDLHAMRVRARNQLLVAFDDIVRVRLGIAWRDGASR